jgi:hypothetical protein
MMQVYATSKNTGPSYHGDPIRLIYLGSDLQKARESVGTFARYQREFNVSYPELYSALPRDIDWEMVEYFMADGWWYSIVQFNL